MPLTDKIILITGGTGSFGTALTRVLLDEYNPRAIRIYSRGELLQDEMARRFNDGRLRFLIGDVRDRDRLRRAMSGVDVVVHAAAIKQIPTAEYNPSEAVFTNINGAINVIDAALDTGVGKVMAIQTDKNCYPVNLYGATKLVAEKLFIQANVYTGARKQIFSCVRYGNVIGSRGSVIPLFLQQGASGKVTVTDEHMTRFWLTLEQGVRFVIDCLERMRGGEIFVPKIPSMKVVDIANAVAPEADVEIIGLRAGEKLHEMLISEEESAHTLEFDDYFVITPEFAFWGDGYREQGDSSGGVPMERGRYGSDNNEWWLTKDELRGLLGQ